jgi:CRP-like cAMP-binding protein
MTTSCFAAVDSFVGRLLSQSALSLEEQLALRSLPTETSQLRTNEVFVTPGRPIEHATFVLDGLVARFDPLRNGTRELTALYIPGDLCDLRLVVLPAPCWGLVALTTTTIVRIPLRRLMNLASSHPAIALAFWRDAAVDASITAKWVSNLGCRAALARIAHLFCELGLRYERAGTGTRTRYPFAATQAHLGDLMGLTSIHVNRTMMALRESGLIENDRRLMRIKNWDGLIELAEFDPEYLLIQEPRQQAA